MATKQCTKCGEIKDLDEDFHIQTTNLKDGHQSWCKTCTNVGRGPERTTRRLIGVGAGTKIDLERLNRRLMSTLNKDSLHLFRLAQEEKLERDEAQSLVNYIKLTKDLLAQEAVKEKELSDEQLEAIANQGKTDPHVAE
jgi:hypothetical protein